MMVIYKPVWILAPSFIGSRYVTSSLDNNKYRVINYFDDQRLAADKLSMLNTFNEDIIDYITAKCKNDSCNYTQQKIAINLPRRYNPDSLIENDPKSAKDTSYSQFKGKLLSVCLREKITGGNELHDNNTLKFVDLHELSHIASNSYGHNKEFWNTFEQMLHEAAESDLYTPIDYSESPINYCGVAVNYNPYYN